MRCPTCNAPESLVRDSRPDRGNTVRRRRECARCRFRFTTYEMTDDQRFERAKSTRRDLKVKLRDVTEKVTKLQNEVTFLRHLMDQP